jgi:carboxyl-terminal processing protease
MLITHQKSVLLLIFLTLNLFAHSQDSKIRNHAYMIVKSAEKFHYKQIHIDNSFSEKVYYNFFKIIDPYSLVFTQSDISKYNHYKELLDDQILQKELSFLKSVSALYLKKLNELKSFYLSIQNSEIQFFANDSLKLNVEERKLNETEKYDLLLKILKFKILIECVGEKDTVLTKNHFTQSAIDNAKDICIINEICRLETKLSDSSYFQKYMGSVYLHSIAHSFDPHTSYFSAEDMDEFERYVSKEKASFGIQITTDNNYKIIIDKLIPGGPAWDSEQIHEGDIILKVKSSEGKIRDFNCIRLNDANRYLLSDKNTAVSFYIRKKNGRELWVELTKEVLSVEENVINSFILNNSRKIGYIRIPAFYSDFDIYSVKGCANDLSKEVIKLKRNGIIGLIIDLRDNGGGSLFEAVKAAGLFIDFGALGILDSRLDDIRVLKDTDRGVLYTDPIIVLMNSSSASASEFFAAALQDYNRAIIAGSRSFGKSTSQIVLPIDAYVNFNYNSNYDKTAEAYIKLTSGYFFRVTGKSHQKYGIIPDIEIHDNSSAFRESDFETSLDSISIDKKTWFKPLVRLPIDMLSEKSEQRQKKQRFAKDKSFHLKPDSDYTIPLNVNSFIEFINSDFKEYEPNDADTLFTVLPFDYLKRSYTDISSSNIILNQTANNIRTDLTIYEAYNIMNDFNKIYKQ